MRRIARANADPALSARTRGGSPGRYGPRERSSRCAPGEGGRAGYRLLWWGRRRSSSPATMTVGHWICARREPVECPRTSREVSGVDGEARALRPQGGRPAREQLARAGHVPLRQEEARKGRIEGLPAKLPAERQRQEPRERERAREPDVREARGRGHEHQARDARGMTQRHVLRHHSAERDADHVGAVTRA